jgi:hypothetical protein
MIDYDRLEVDNPGQAEYL